MLFLKRLLRDEAAVTSVEYAVMLAMILLAVIGMIGLLGAQSGGMWGNIVDELGGEKIDIVRWNESSQILIANALKPAEVEEVSLCFELGRGTIIVREDQLSSAIGRRGQNVRLAVRLTGWKRIRSTRTRTTTRTAPRAMRTFIGAVSASRR